MSATPILNNFSAGELSPRLNGRVDLDAYHRGAAYIENMWIQPQGGVTRRPGTRYMGQVKNASTPPRLVNFEFSDAQSYVIEMGAGYCRFWADRGNVISGAAPYEIANSFGVDDLNTMQWAQYGDTLYIATGESRPYVLRRYGHTDWRLSAFDFQNGPFQAENSDESHTISRSGTSGGISLNASTDVFEAGHVNALWRFREPVSEEAIFTHIAENSSTPVAIPDKGVFDWSVVLNAAGADSISLQRSSNGGTTWSTISSYSNTNSGEHQNATHQLALYRWTVTRYSGGPVAVVSTITYESEEDDYNGIVQINAVTDAQNASATVIVTNYTTRAIHTWSEGAWSTKAGWPRCVGLFEQRTVWAGSDDEPMSIWLSKVAEHNIFTPGVEDDDAITWPLAAQKQARVSWVSALKTLFFGTSAGPWRMASAEDAGEALTPTNVMARLQGAWPSAREMAVDIGNRTAYIHRHRRRVLDNSFDWLSDSYTAQDLTLMAEHIGGRENGSTLVRMAVLNDPDPILFCVRSDGYMPCLTYNHAHEVLGWTRNWSSDAYFEDAVAIPGQYSDELWCLVRRTIGGSDVRYLEMIDPRDFESTRDAWFVDCGILYDGVGTNVITGLAHLEGMNVTVWNSGAVEGVSNIVSGGQVTIKNEMSYGIIGIDYRSMLYTMNLEVPTRRGTSQTKSIKVSRVGIRAYRSGVFRYGGWDAPIGDGAELYTLAADPPTYYGSAPDLYTGDFEFDLMGRVSPEARVYIESYLASPLTVLAIVPYVDVGDR